MSREADSSLRVKDVVQRIVRREAASFDENDPRVRESLEVEAIHQLRVSARRLRSELGAMRDVLPREPWGELSDDLQIVGATLGGLRDLDVLQRLLEAHVSAGSPLHAALTEALDTQRARQRHWVTGLLDSARYRRVRRRLTTLSSRPALGEVGRASAPERLTPVLWTATCRYLEVIGDPTRPRDDDELHQVRIASKRCRYNFEIGSLFLGEPAREVARHLASVQDVLGDVHDRVVAGDFVGQLTSAPGAERREVRAALRGEINDVLSQWPGRFLAARRAMLSVFADVVPRDREP